MSTETSDCGFFRTFYRSSSKSEHAESCESHEVTACSSVSAMETSDTHSMKHRRNGLYNEHSIFARAAQARRQWKSKKKLKHYESDQVEEQVALEYPMSCTGVQYNLLSKRASLIIPFTSTPAEMMEECPNLTCFMDYHAPIARSGVLIKQMDHFKTWKKRLMILKGQSLFYYVSGNAGDDACPRGVIPLLNVKVNSVEANRFKRHFCFEISQTNYRSVYFMANNENEMELWMASIASASMPLTRDRKRLAVTASDLEKHKTKGAMPLEDALPYQRICCFRQKIAFCLPHPSDVYLSISDQFELIEHRLTTLYDLVHYCDSYLSLWNDPHLYAELIDLVGSYIFEPVTTETLDELQSLESTQHWNLLTACYDLLLKAIEHVECFDKAYRKEIFSTRFTSQLVQSFRSPDLRERLVLKGVLHRYYYKLIHCRFLIRKEMANFLYEFLYESETFLGVHELLEILKSIVNGFSIPMKKEHAVLLEKALIPLHKSPDFVMYHNSLLNCMIQFISKDARLLDQIVNGILRYWPIGNSYKEMLFIVELEELIEHTNKLPESLYMAITNRLVRCMKSPHFQIAERAIAFYHAPACLCTIRGMQEKSDVYKIIEALRDVIRNHWSLNVRMKAEEVYTVFYNMGLEEESEFVSLLKEMEEHVIMRAKECCNDKKKDYRTKFQWDRISQENEFLGVTDLLERPEKSLFGCDVSRLSALEPTTTAQVAAI